MKALIEISWTHR